MVLQSVLDVCAKETGYEGEGRRSDTWWRQEAPETHLRENLEEILREARKGNGLRGTRSTSQKGTAGEVKRGFGDAGT